MQKPNLSSEAFGKTSGPLKGSYNLKGNEKKRKCKKAARK